MKKTVEKTLLCATLGINAIASAQSLEPIVLTLSPGKMIEATGQGTIDVTVEIPDVNVASGSSVLELPLVVSNADSAATTLQMLSAEDARGPLTLHSRDDPPASDAARHWYADRAVKGRFSVRYRVPIDDTPPKRGTSPPFSLRTEGGGFSGVGNIFVLLPEQSTEPKVSNYAISIRWRLANLGAGATATSSYGDGNVDLPPGPVSRLARTAFMAGPIHRIPETAKPTGFSANWLGTPPSDPKPLMQWGERLHRWMGTFFRDDAASPYRVFLRYNPINAGGGTALTKSFLLTYGDDFAPQELKATLSHEMIHTWTFMPKAQWYTEGIAVFYEALLPWRAGLFTSEQFIKDVNETAARYYANSKNDTPDDQISAHFWEDSRVRVLPYDRSSMYFSILNARIRAASGGKRSIDDLVSAMNLYRNGLIKNGDDTETLWKNLLARELGAPGLEIHRAMKAGELMLPASGDFGPCFQRVSKPMRRFELGFAPKSLLGKVKIIRGMIPGSEAAKAGLRDGDVVDYRVAMDIVQSKPTSTLTLYVTRGDKTFPLTYLPRGDQVEVWQWQRIAGMPEDTCTL